MSTLAEQHDRGRTKEEMFNELFRAKYGSDGARGSLDWGQEEKWGTVLRPDGPVALESLDALIKSMSMPNL